MADRVIVIGTRRGMSDVPASEIKQMVGRAGRTHGTDAHADVLVEYSKKDTFIKEIESDYSMPVNSSLHEKSLLAFHVLPEICSGRIRSEKTFNKWYSKTLSYYQGKKCTAQSVFDYLSEYNSIEQGDWVTATEYGRISASLYLRPEDVMAWCDNFDDLFSSGFEDNLTASCWALANAPHTKAVGDLGKYRELISICKDNLPRAFELTHGSITSVVAWWYLMGGPSVGPLRNQALSLKDDFGRIYRAMTLIDRKVKKWNRSEYFERLQIMVSKQVGPELIGLCKLTGVGKTRGLALYNMGIKNLDELKSRYEKLEGEVDTRFWNVIKALV